MNVFTKVLYRYAAGLMTNAEYEKAFTLAKEADAGNQTSATMLRGLVLEVWADREHRRPREHKRASDAAAGV